jgi:hypothetical protein
VTTKNKKKAKHLVKNFEYEMFAMNTKDYSNTKFYLLYNPTNKIFIIIIRNKLISHKNIFEKVLNSYLNRTVEYNSEKSNILADLLSRSPALYDCLTSAY